MRCIRHKAMENTLSHCFSDKNILLNLFLMYLVWFSFTCSKLQRIMYLVHTELNSNTPILISAIGRQQIKESMPVCLVLFAPSFLYIGGRSNSRMKARGHNNCLFYEILKIRELRCFLVILKRMFLRKILN